MTLNQSQKYMVATFGATLRSLCLPGYYSYSLMTEFRRTVTSTHGVSSGQIIRLVRDWIMYVCCFELYRMETPTPYTPILFPDEILFDPASLFPNRTLPAEGSVIDLTSLKAALRPKEEPRFDETFIPDRIYMRAEMQQLFRELVSDAMYMKVFSGSPGIGKSILLFLVAIFRTWTEENRKVLYEVHAIPPRRL
jgi:hypothetical protein